MSELTTGCGLGHWTTHELRHSAGSLLFAAGVPMKLISEMLGHSSERVTSDIYVHTEQAARDRVAEAMAGVLFAAEEQPEPLGGQYGGQLTDGNPVQPSELGFRAPLGTRTQNLRIKSPLLCQIELEAHPAGQPSRYPG